MGHELIELNGLAGGTGVSAAKWSGRNWGHFEQK